MRSRWSKPGMCLPDLQVVASGVGWAEGRREGGSARAFGGLDDLGDDDLGDAAGVMSAGVAVRAEAGALLVGHDAVCELGCLSAGRSRWSMRGWRSRRSGCLGLPVEALARPSG